MTFSSIKLVSTVTLVAVLLGLAVVVKFQLDQEPQFVAPMASFESRKTTAKVAITEISEFPKLETYSEITARPIFSRSRRPPKLDAETQPRPVQQPVNTPIETVTAVPKLQAKLVGVIYSESRGIALIQDGSSAKLTRLSTGDTHLGWSVVAVDKHSITLAANGEKLKLSIEFRKPTNMTSK